MLGSWFFFQKNLFYYCCPLKVVSCAKSQVDDFWWVKVPLNKELLEKANTFFLPLKTAKKLTPGCRNQFVLELFVK